GCRPPPQVGTINAVSSHTASIGKLAHLGDHWQPIRQGEASDPLAEGNRESVGEREQCIREVPPDRGQCNVEFLRGARLERAQGQAYAARRLLRVLPFGD